MLQQHGRVLGEIPVVKYQQEFGAVGTESLNGMGDAGGEIPEIALFGVADKASALVVDGSNSRGAVEHDGPLGGGVPMQFANASGGESHVDSGHGLGDGQLSDCDFA